jgi:exodeoxyribonuclease VII large subunit
MEQISIQWEPDRRIFTVGELTEAIRATLEREFQDVWVAGEISGVRLAASGHYYFTLKDGAAQLRCVCFRNAARLLRFKPQDGIAALARGRIDVYEARGEYQLLVETLEPQGYGALQLAFEQLKRKLAEEGFFDESRKRPLPKAPRRIGIVTSPSGAVIRDMLQILNRRFPGLHVRLYPAQVQGEGSVEQVVEAIEWFSRSNWPEVVIVARGGGSLEDLWTFNEEAVARAIACCSVPVISAIGHETDVTIADFVADLRAPTPSAAAELVTPSKQEILEQLSYFLGQIERALRYRLAEASRKLHELGMERAAALLHRSVGRKLQGVDELDYRMRGRLHLCLQQRKAGLRNLEDRLLHMDLRVRLAAARRRLDFGVWSTRRQISDKLNQCRGVLESLSARLITLSPLAILERGYAIVQDEEGRIIKAAIDAPRGALLRVRFASGRVRARVTESIPDGNSELPS